MADSHARLLRDLALFVRDEQHAASVQLLKIWEQALQRKLASGWTQALTGIELVEPGLLRATFEGGHTRFREGDVVLLHTASPLDDLLARELVIETEDDDGWLLRGAQADAAVRMFGGRTVYADPDRIDLTGWIEQALRELADSAIGRDVVLPLLAGTLPITFDAADVRFGERAARARDLNPQQASAVGLALGAEQIACIQGPPGTGKSSVLALAVRLMVERGERVWVTSSTHRAINHLLDKIAAEGVAVAKIGRATQSRGIHPEVSCHEDFGDWHARPARGGYAVGATPFASMTQRLEGCEFDAVVFDEASQVTVPLALMAMRKGWRFVFVGDQRQLPPVVLSRSVLDAQSMSAFTALTRIDADHGVMLDQTYRLNRWLAAWPSRTHYGGRLRAAGANRERRLALHRVPAPLAGLLDGAAPGVFVATDDLRARTANQRDAELCAALCAAAVASGLAPDDIAVVTPFRAQARAVRNALGAALRGVVADTVERMQGQERECVIVSLASGDVAFLATVAGFVFQPQRLNVAITRAKTKLIVIGPDPATLAPHPEPEVQRWIEQYADLVRHLARVAR